MLRPREQPCSHLAESGIDIRTSWTHLQLLSTVLEDAMQLTCRRLRWVLDHRQIQSFCMLASLQNQFKVKRNFHLSNVRSSLFILRRQWNQFYNWQGHFLYYFQRL